LKKLKLLRPDNTKNTNLFSKYKIDEERRTALRRDTCPRFISYGLGI
jgi:hypothetical protein